MLRANGAFTAVAVPAGRHEVPLVYGPLSVRLGLGISASTALGVLAAVIWLTAAARRMATAGVARRS